MWLTKLVLVSTLALSALSWGPAPSSVDARDGAIVSLVETEATPSNVEQRHVLTIGTTFSNNGGRLDGLSVEIDVRAADGTSVLHEKQTGLRVSAGDERSVYWEWRIPQRVSAGSYVVGVDVLDNDGQHVLASDPEAASFFVTQ
ncbi:MAG: hypothetical protein EPO21_16655 [Chloroflexota bacterium]|nr:MAG: hypothetical protein EPO21_16655 [Chloroflexota bacterium]